MIDHEEAQDLAAVDALGMLPAGISPDCDAVRLREHLASCPECRAEHAAMRSAAGAIAFSAEATERDLPALGAARMKSRLMRAVRGTTAVAPAVQRRTLAWPGYLAAAAAIAIAIVTALTNAGLKADRDALGDKVVALQQRATAETKAAAEAQAVVADLVAADAKHFAVRNGEVVRRGDRLYLAMNSLPPLAKGRVYQAWTLKNGAKSVAPSVTFLPSRSGVAVVRLPEPASDIALIAVSIEPEGGSKAPTTKPTFARKLS